MVTASRDPSRCTHSSHRCHHAAHAYTGVPCSGAGTARRHQQQRHRQRKPGAGRQAPAGGAGGGGGAAGGHQGPGGGVLPRIGQQQQPPVTLQLKQGGSVQALRLPTDKLEPNKKYYVTFTLKPKENGKHQFENVQRQSSVY